jgi:hypothetical protein
MDSTTRAFVMGIGTTFAILTAGFGTGLLFARHTMDRTPPNTQSRTAADSLPPVRVILPLSADVAKPRETSEVNAQPVESSQAIAAPQDVLAQIVPDNAAQQTAENDKKAGRVERRRSELENKQRRHRIAEQRAKRDAARVAKRMQQQEQQPPGREPGILAFDDEQPPRVSRGLFGN